MDRRIFLLSSLALGACTTTSPQTLICDPGFSGSLTRAKQLYGKLGPMSTAAVGPAMLLKMAEGEESAVVVTSQALLANRLQRLGYVRLEHRWQAQIQGTTAQILVTKGSGPGQWRALRFARWLASDAATSILAAPPPSSSDPDAP